MNVSLQGFAPIFHDKIEVLVLGSMPGGVSLVAQQYYAHPRNAFWPIMAETFNFNLEMNYQDRVKALLDSNVGLWDVLARCTRDGSLDSNIQLEGIQVNQFSELFLLCNKLKIIALNGAKAYELFNKHIVSKGLLPANISTIKLPSTSPAHASMSFEAKLLAWSDAVGPKTKQ